VTVSGRPVKVGRDLECDLRLRDEGVSRVHLQLRLLADDQLEVQDLGSNNGTFVDGRLTVLSVLTPGGKVVLGLNSVLRFEVQDGFDQAYHRQMYDARVRDWLTGAHNRRYFDEQLPVELSYARRQGRDLAILYLDVDHFKKVNDDYGHAVGDAVLVALVRSLRTALRAEDVLARIGGEEFAILARGTRFEGAHLLAVRIREDIAALKVIHSEDAPAISITVSVGAVAISPNSKVSPEEVMAATDRNLYAAKDAGRNRELVTRLENAVDPTTSQRRLIHTYRLGESAGVQLKAKLAAREDDAD